MCARPLARSTAPIRSEPRRIPNYRSGVGVCLVVVVLVVVVMVVAAAARFSWSRCFILVLLTPSVPTAEVWNRRALHRPALSDLVSGRWQLRLVDRQWQCVLRRRSPHPLPPFESVRLLLTRRSDSAQVQVHRGLLRRAVRDCLGYNARQ